MNIFIASHGESLLYLDKGIELVDTKLVFGKYSIVHAIYPETGEELVGAKGPGGAVILFRIGAMVETLDRLVEENLPIVEEEIPEEEEIEEEIVENTIEEPIPEYEEKKEYSIGEIVYTRDIVAMVSNVRLFPTKCRVMSLERKRQNKLPITIYVLEEFDGGRITRRGKSEIRVLKSDKDIKLENVDDVINPEDKSLGSRFSFMRDKRG